MFNFIELFHGSSNLTPSHYKSTSGSTMHFLTFGSALSWFKLVLYDPHIPHDTYLQ